MYRFSQHVIRVPLWQCFSNCKVSFCGPYSCLFCKMCAAYANCGLLYLMYLICSFYLIFINLPVCPIYTLLHVLHCSLYIPLGFVLLVFSFDNCCWIVLVVLKAMIMFVSLNRFVIFLIIRLKYVNVVNFFDWCFIMVFPVCKLFS